MVLSLFGKDGTGGALDALIQLRARELAAEWARAAQARKAATHPRRSHYTGEVKPRALAIAAELGPVRNRAARIADLLASEDLDVPDERTIRGWIQRSGI